jgi:hypothetical protein
MASPDLMICDPVHDLYAAANPLLRAFAANFDRDESRKIELFDGSLGGRAADERFRQHLDGPDEPTMDGEQPIDSKNGLRCPN